MKVDVGLDALGDRTRRQILGRLARGAASVGELAELLPVGRPAVSMHLRVLREAGLVTARAEGTRRLYQLEPDALAALRDYLDWLRQDRRRSNKREELATTRRPAPALRHTKPLEGVPPMLDRASFTLAIPLSPIPAR